MAQDTSYRHPDLELAAEAYAEIAEVMGRRGRELAAGDDPYGPELTRWAICFQRDAAEMAPDHVNLVGMA